jgi:hypothetical protein
MAAVVAGLRYGLASTAADLLTVDAGGPIGAAKAAALMLARAFERRRNSHGLARIDATQACNHRLTPRDFWR